MGTGGSIAQTVESGGEKRSGNVIDSEVVIKDIPIEYHVPKKGKPISVRSVGSFGKGSKNRMLVNNKSASLRSALSLDFDPEIEKLRKEVEAVRASNQAEVLELRSRNERLQNENKRLRREIKYVNTACGTMKQERDEATEKAIALEKRKSM